MNFNLRRYNLVSEGSTDPQVHNALGMILIDSNSNPEHFLTTNEHYDSKAGLPSLCTHPGCLHFVHTRAAYHIVHTLFGHLLVLDVWAAYGSVPMVGPATTTICVLRSHALCSKGPQLLRGMHSHLH